MAMKQTHRREKEQFVALFRQENVDRLEDRFQILETFLQTEQHVTVVELMALLKAAGHAFDMDFVLESLKLMCHFGFARKNRFDNGQVRYEHHHLGQHHDHMVCIKCRRILEFEDTALERLQQQIATRHGFYLLQHKLDIYGLCAECLDNRIDILTLADARPGEKVVLTDFLGGSSVRSRLFSMGLKIGDRVEVVTNMNKGQVAVAVDLNRFVLGRGLAEKILVQPETELDFGD